MHKTHEKAKSVTYSEHTKHCSGFVHKVRLKDKIKTVRISPPEQAKKNTRPYRNVAIAHIKNLRGKTDIDLDINPLQETIPFSRYSFFYDDSLNHALVHTKPLTNAVDADAASKLVAMTSGNLNFNGRATGNVALMSKEEQIKAMINKTNKDTPSTNKNTSRHMTNPNGANTIHGVSYKSNDVLQLQNGLPSALKQRFALARIRNSKLTLIDWLISLPPSGLSEEIKEALDEIINPPPPTEIPPIDNNNDDDENNNNNNNNKENEKGNTSSITARMNEKNKNTQQSINTPPNTRIDPHTPSHQPSFSYDELNFKPPRVMSLDIGTQYIGVALSDEKFEKAIPVGVINLLSDTPTNAAEQSLIQTINPTFRVEPATIAQQLNTFRKRYNVICTCVGLPQTEFNDHMVVKIKTFTANMITLHGLGQGQFEVCYIDEHHTTQEARKRILAEDERDEEFAQSREGYSHTGQGGERRKKLKAKSKHYDDLYQKKKDIDAEAAAIILERFIELTNDFGDKYSERVHQLFTDSINRGDAGIAAKMHTM